MVSSNRPISLGHGGMESGRCKRCRAIDPFRWVMVARSLVVAQRLALSPSFHASLLVMFQERHSFLKVGVQAS
ncbi:hypothetical protein VNI00_004211 [Paramarasmius palmivorus]|uniref:Uncharacterized protein n=1 Tax=Paramarasmius palmivorus TaxID=297713 RepID=A0AAW0DPZ5_9AGAR